MYQVNHWDKPNWHWERITEGRLRFLLSLMTEHVEDRLVAIRMGVMWDHGGNIYRWR